MVGGYMGKILWVDLSRGELIDEVLDPKLCRNFLGGYGMGARIIFDRQKACVDPLGSDNTLGILTGPLTGTPALTGSRYVVVGKSPLTGSWGDANSGGDFGPHLKFAGYDAVFFTGISQKPVYLFIEDGKAELRDAAYLWGKDTFETDDLVRSAFGKEVKAISIGPAGEKLSLISCPINNKGRAPGRSGLGAVMGSKRLKAVAVKGKMKIPLADEKRAKELRRTYLSQLTGSIVEELRKYGTAGGTTWAGHSGQAPVKNWGGVGIFDFSDIASIGGEAVIEHQEKKYACWHCPIACGGHMREEEGEYKYKAGAHKPEYETLGAFGIMCLNNNLKSIIKANDICNRYGLDTISAGSTIAFAIECYENGLITKEDTGGIEMTWGNHGAIIAMTEKLAKREGFGDILADGIKIAAVKIGKGAEQYAMHIQGQEIPMQDPKYWGLDIVIPYMLDATPSRHTQRWHIAFSGLPIPELESLSGRCKALKMGRDFGHIVNCAGICRFLYWSLLSSHLSANAVSEFISAVTGRNISIDELLEIGDRVATMRHAFNIREGLNPLQFEVPNRVLGKPPQERGPLAGVIVDKETMINEYLNAIGYDPKTTKPSKEKLLYLGLDDVAEQLWP